MTITPPDGFLTRPEASGLYNRSQRALERDLDAAQRTKDTEVLMHWRLLTKDGVIREAEDLEPAAVKQLQTDGLVPVWCVSKEYLHKAYGKRGTPKPQRERKGTIIDREVGDNPKSDNVQGQASTDDESSVSLPDDTAFLKERIRVLEQEKRDEAARNEKREAKLFEQLAVKDKQISAWDEITQGLTRGLATGQISPSLNPGSSGSTKPKTDSTKNDDRGQVVDVETAASDAVKKKPSRSPRKARKKKGKKSSPKRTSRKPKWYETPTLNRFFDRD
jgi:hypothetical protein